jgi:hypothetical protein
MAEALAEFRRFNYEHIYMRPASRWLRPIACQQGLAHLGWDPAKLPRGIGVSGI